MLLHPPYRLKAADQVVYRKVNPMLSLLVPGAVGAVGGGFSGLIDPGNDEHGQQRSRVSEALWRALKYGLLGSAFGGLGAASLIEERGVSKDEAPRRRTDGSRRQPEPAPKRAPRPNRGITDPNEPIWAALPPSSKVGHVKLADGYGRRVARTLRVRVRWG